MMPNTTLKKKGMGKDQNENEKVTQLEHDVELLSLTCQILEVIQGETSTTAMELMAIHAIIIK